MHYTQVRNSTKLLVQHNPHFFTLDFPWGGYWNCESWYVVKDENNNSAGFTNIHGVSRYDVVKKKSVGIIKRMNRNELNKPKQTHWQQFKTWQIVSKYLPGWNSDLIVLVKEIS